MHTLYSRLPRLFLACILLAAAQAQANTGYVADFQSTTVDPSLVPSMVKNGGYNSGTNLPITPGVALPWMVSSGGGDLTLAKTFTLPGNLYVDGPHVFTNFGTTGDFVATVTTDSSFNGAGAAGFFLDSSFGYTGISFGTSWLNDSGGNGFSSTGYNAAATPLLTLQIKRQGDTLTKSYKLDGASAFTIISTFTNPGVEGYVGFDLTNWSDQTAATAVQFSSFTITPLTAVPEPASYAMLLGGLGLVGWLARRRAQPSA